MSIYTNWDPLELCIVGNCLTEVPDTWSIDPKAKPLLEKILKETKEDLDNLAALISSFNTKVLRPTPKIFPQKSNLHNFSILNATNPIVPRDQYFVYDKTIYQTYTSLPDRYFDGFNYYSLFKDLFKQGHNWLSLPPPILNNLNNNEKWYLDGQDIYHNRLNYTLLWHTATMFKAGKDIIVNNQGPGTQLGLEWIKRNVDAEFIHNEDTYVDSWGHIDHGFYMPNDNTVICMDEHWVPQCLRNKELILLDGLFERFDYKNFIEETNNKVDPFSYNWLEDWFDQWTGYCQEVAFEANVLVVDPNNIIFATEQPEVFAKLGEYNINCHVSKLRHGMFWAGGIHCMTLDIKRSGLKRCVI